MSSLGIPPSSPPADGSRMCAANIMTSFLECSAEMTSAHTCAHMRALLLCLIEHVGYFSRTGCNARCQLRRRGGRSWRGRGSLSSPKFKVHELRGAEEQHRKSTPWQNKERNEQDWSAVKTVCVRAQSVNSNTTVKREISCKSSLWVFSR